MEDFKNKYFKNFSFEEINRLAILVKHPDMLLLQKYLMSVFEKGCVVVGSRSYIDSLKPLIDISRNRGIADCIELITKLDKKIESVYQEIKIIVDTTTDK